MSLSVSKRAGQARAPLRSPLPALPTHLVLKDGQVLLTRGDTWPLRVAVDGGDKIAVRFGPIRRFADARFVAIAKLFVAEKALTSMAGSLVNYADALKRAAEYWSESGGKVSWGRLGAEEFQALRQLGMSRVTGNGRALDFTRVREIYKWGAFAAELPDFSAKTASAIRALRTPGNPKGLPVLSHDPNTGPFSPEEQSLIHTAIKRGVGDIRDRMVVQLLLELALRPIQLLRMFWRGLRCYSVDLQEPDGSWRTVRRYTVQVPSAKGRTGKRYERARPITSLLGDSLASLPPADPVKDKLVHWINHDASGVSEQLILSIRRWFTAAAIIAPRTKKPIHVHMYRFRYTLPTEAARDGASKLQIADLLGHSDTQHVEVYIDAAGTVMQQIEERLDASVFGDQLSAFVGKVVDRANPRPWAGVPRQVVPGVMPAFADLPAIPTGIGACGEKGLCRLAPPLTCYLCPKFAAFRDAPHGEIASKLLQLIVSRFAERADARYVGELVPVCRAAREVHEQIQREAAS